MSSVAVAVLFAGCGGQGGAEAKRGDATSQRPTGGDAQPAASEEPHAGGEVVLEKITLTAPESWIRRPAASSFLLAEFELPAAEGDEENGRLTVSVAGGSIEANVERWRGQFPQGTANDSQEQVDVEGMDVTVVDLSGEFHDQRGPFTPVAKRPGYRMLAAIIPVDNELHFIKLTGPENTVQANTDEFDQFVRSVRKN